MKKIVFVIVLAGALVLGGLSKGFACGQKYLVKNFAVNKAQCYTAAKPGTILIYKTANDAVTGKAFGKDFERSLAEAGHKVMVVEGAEVLKSTVGSETFDVILSGYPTVEEVEKALQQAGKKAKLVPVVDKSNKAELDAAKGRYGNVIKNTDRTSTKILMLNEMMEKAAKNTNSGT